MQTPRYTLRLSVRPLGKSPIDGLESEPTLEVGPIRVRVKQRGPYLILQASEFDSASEADAFLPRLKGALWNIAIEHNIAFIPHFERRDITRPEDPYVAARHLAKSFGIPVDESLPPVHGLSEEEGYTVYRTGENIRFIGFGGASAHVSTGWEQVSSTLSAGIEKVQPSAARSEGNLETAIDLYLSSFYETSIRARFLTLMTALEVLAPITEKHSVATRLLADLEASIDAQLAVETDQEARDALESLRRETEFRKETSIRRRIRRLVLDKAPLDANDRENLAKSVVEAYDLRGSVVHAGAADPNALSAANETALRATKLLLQGLLGLAVAPTQS